MTESQQNHVRRAGADAGCYLAVPAKKLAVIWLLLRNSQTGHKHLKMHHKSSRKIQHNSQQKKSPRKQPGTASFLP